MILTDDKGVKYIPSDPEGLAASYFWLHTKTNKLTPAVFYRNSANKSNYVILYSHGNSTDIARMRWTLQDLSLILNVHVFAYEYSGYGPTEGKPNDLEILYDIISAYDFLIDTLKFQWTEIIVYGRSIGSGPSTFLASHPKYPVIGLILHAPIASGLRVLNTELSSSYKIDLFPNCDFIQHVNAHTYIMHGLNDEEVPVSHGKMLAKQAKNPTEPWWVEGAGHNNIDAKYREKYFVNIASKKSQKELEEFYYVKDWHSEYNHIYFTEAPKLVKKAQIQILKNPDAVSQFILNNTSMINLANESFRDSSRLSRSFTKRNKPIDFTLRTEAEEEKQEYVPPSLMKTSASDIEMGYSRKNSNPMLRDSSLENNARDSLKTDKTNDNDLSQSTIVGMSDIQTDTSMQK